MRARYNELKFEILQEANNWEEFTAEEMANALGRTHCSIAMALFRYYKCHLLSRRTIANNEKLYSMTVLGYERLEWLYENYEYDE